MSTLTTVQAIRSTALLGQRSIHPPTKRSSNLSPGLLARATQGFKESEFALANSLGHSAYLETQLNYQNIDDSQNENLILNAYPFLNLTTQQMLNNGANNVQDGLTRATLRRAIHSKRQLFERMVEFWGDHFNISIGENGLPEYLRTEFDWSVLRAHALGKFPDMLRACAHSAAMMIFLNNDQNIVGNPNENYSRELLELHTMGADNGYTQQDVMEVSRCLSGWGTSSWGGGFTFQYHPTLHDNQMKTVMGQIIPAGGGQNDGEMVLNILANHPNTARFIGKKMLRWLLNYEPTLAQVEGIAQVYLTTGGDIKAMVRYALDPARLSAKNPKFKRPFHLFVSTLRALNASVALNADIVWRLQEAGQMPFRWDPPNGYPDSLDFWAGLMLPRWNFVTSLMDRGISGITYDVSQITQGATTAAALADRIDAALFGGQMLPTDKAAITNYLKSAPTDARRIKEAIGLAFAAPSFQWY